MHRQFDNAGGLAIEQQFVTIIVAGIRESIEEERWADATKYIGVVAGVLNAYSAQLDKATRLL